MPKVPYEYLQRWCQEHGWTDLFMEQRQFWAFPPGAVLPLPIPAYAFEGFQHNRLSGRSLLLNAAAVVFTLGGICLTALTYSPMPLLSAFAISTIIVALLPEQI
jgi:hypothetical protein